ncbi:MAG: AsmA-like C-terminal region-containing protein [Desulfobacterales bacterium]
MEHAVGKRLNADAEINGLTINFFSGISIDSITVAPFDPDTTEPEAGVIDLSDIKLDLSLASFVSAGFLPKSIEIGDINASLNTQSLNWLLSLNLGMNISEKMPAIQVRDGSISFDHQALEKPFHINDLKIKGPAGEMISVTGKTRFGDKKDCLDFKMNLDSSYAQAEIRAENFDISTLSALNIPEKIYAGIRPGLGEKLTGRISARISLKSRTVTLQNGFFHSPGGSLEISSGGMGFDGKGIERAWVRAEAKKINLTTVKDFIKNLQVNKTAEAQIKGGKINIDGIARWGRDDGLDYQADVSVRDGSAYLSQLKTGIDNIEAEIEVSSPGKIKIRRSAGWVSDGKIEASGFFDMQNRAAKNYRMELDLEKIRGNDGMHRILPANVREVMEDMQVQDPVVSGRIVLASEHSDVELEVTARRTRMPGLPFTILNPGADIKWNSGNKKIYFNQCRGNIDGGSLSGNMVLKYDGPVNADFNLYGRRLPINRELRQWLELDKTPWKITGGYDIELRASNWRSGENSPAGALKHLQIQTDLRDVAVSHSEHGEVAGNWYGHLSMDENGLRLTDFRGDIFGTEFHASGTIPGHDLPKAQISLESENIALNEELYSRIPFGEKLKRTGINGQCELRAELDGLHSGWMPESGSVSTVIHSLNTGDGMPHLSAGGTARFTFSAPEAEDIGVEGVFDINRISLEKFDANRISGDFSYNDGKIKIPGVKINAYGGNIRVTDSIVNIEKGSWRTKLLPVRMDLESIFAAFGITGRNTPAGSLRGEIELKGNGLDSEAVSGSGTIKVARGMLYDFPIFASVFNVLDLQIPRQRPITDAYGSFDIEDGRITINDLLLTGGTVPMHTEGSLGVKKGVDFRDQEIDLLITAAKTDGFLDRVPLVNWIKHYTLDLFRRLAMQVEINGTIGDYKIKRLSSPVTTPIERMWSLMEKLAPSSSEREGLVPGPAQEKSP